MTAPNTPIRLAVAGANGRMGRCTIERALRDGRFELAAALTAPDDPALGSNLSIGDRTIPLGDRFADSDKNPCDVLIDFSVACGTMVWLPVCERLGIPMVIGATGHSPAQLARIGEAACAIPIMRSGNFSLGMNAILAAIGALVRAVGPEFDIEIVETHHRHKVDAPSGTALAILDEIRRARPTADPSDTGDAGVVFGRRGKVGQRPPGQIGVHAVRMGEIIGQHEIHLSGGGESITIRHQAHSREAFAAGALSAAAWIAGKPAGLYTMRDVLAARTDPHQ
ncbi:MAG: 4-hydroxy-tetrahydrodipicolinate reductase [Planctomycetota bacterium]